MEMIVAYLVGVIVLIGLFAVRVPHEDVRVVFTLALLWPLSILAIAGMMILSATGWDMEVASNEKMFGFRRPTNPQVKGFAVTALTVELQFFKAAK
jgi:multisubunit Na+/H+ antiporter MnhC subunit